MTTIINSIKHIPTDKFQTQTQTTVSLKQKTNVCNNSNSTFAIELIGQACTRFMRCMNLPHKATKIKIFGQKLILKRSLDYPTNSDPSAKIYTVKEKSLIYYFFESWMDFMVSSTYKVNRDTITVSNEEWFKNILKEIPVHYIVDQKNKFVPIGLDLRSEGVIQDFIKAKYLTLEKTNQLELINKMKYSLVPLNKAIYTFECLSIYNKYPKVYSCLKEYYLTRMMRDSWITRSPRPFTTNPFIKRYSFFETPFYYTDEDLYYDQQTTHGKFYKYIDLNKKNKDLQDIADAIRICVYRPIRNFYTDLEIRFTTFEGLIRTFYDITSINTYIEAKESFLKFVLKPFEKPKVLTEEEQEALDDLKLEDIRLGKGSKLPQILKFSQSQPRRRRGRAVLFKHRFPEQLRLKYLFFSDYKELEESFFPHVEETTKKEPLALYKNLGRNLEKDQYNLSKNTPTIKERVTRYTKLEPYSIKTDTLESVYKKMKNKKEIDFIFVPSISSQTDSNNKNIKEAPIITAPHIFLLKFDTQINNQINDQINDQIVNSPIISHFLPVQFLNNQQGYFLPFATTEPEILALIKVLGEYNEEFSLNPPEYCLVPLEYLHDSSKFLVQKSYGRIESFNLKDAYKKLNSIKTAYTYDSFTVLEDEQEIKKTEINNKIEEKVVFTSSNNQKENQLAIIHPKKWKFLKFFKKKKLTAEEIAKAKRDKEIYEDSTEPPNGIEWDDCKSLKEVEDYLRWKRGGPCQQDICPPVGRPTRWDN